VIIALMMEAVSTSETSVISTTQHGVICQKTVTFKLNMNNQFLVVKFKKNIRRIILNLPKTQCCFHLTFSHRRHFDVIDDKNKE
jgi:hypothetical protein